MALSNKFLIQVTGDLGISRSAFTLANTILQGLGIFISPIVSSKLAKGNMRRIQCVSIIGFVLSYASYSLAQNALHLYISSFFTGIFFLNSALIPVSMIITNWFVKKRGLAMSIAMAGIGIGGTIFSPVITSLLDSYGWRRTYQIMAVIILVVALPAAFFLLRKKPEDLGLLPYGSDETASAGRTDAPAPVFNLEVKDCWSKVFFWFFIIGMFLGDNVSMLYIMALLFGLGDAIGTVTPPLITSAIFGAEKYGKAYGIANSFTQVGLSLGSLMVAAIYDASGSYTNAWILLLVLTVGALIGWVGSVWMAKKYRTEA